MEIEEEYIDITNPLINFKLPEIITITDSSEVCILVHHVINDQSNFIEIRFKGFNLAYRSTEEAFLQKFYPKIDNLNTFLFKVKNSQWIARLSLDPAIRSLPEFERRNMMHFGVSLSDDLFEIITNKDPEVVKVEVSKPYKR